MRVLLGCSGLRPRTVSPVWQMPYVCGCCQKRWGFISAWAAAGLREREPGKICNCEVRHVSLHPAPSLGTNTVQISNVRGRDTSQIVLQFQELITFSREQSDSSSSAVGRAVAASSRCRQPSDLLSSQKSQQNAGHPWKGSCEAPQCAHIQSGLCRPSPPRTQSRAQPPPSAAMAPR